MAIPAAEDKLARLRALMKQHNLDVWIVPSDDPHLSGTYLHFAYGA